MYVEAASCALGDWEPDLRRGPLAPSEPGGTRPESVRVISSHSESVRVSPSQSESVRVGPSRFSPNRRSALFARVPAARCSDGAGAYAPGQRLGVTAGVLRWASPMPPPRRPCTLARPLPPLVAS